MLPVSYIILLWIPNCGKSSAKAAIDIINTGLYSLDPQESANNLDSKEVVLMRINGDDSDFEMFNLPASHDCGNTHFESYPIQQLPITKPCGRIRDSQRLQSRP